MIDFLMIATHSPKTGVLEIYPKFVIKQSNDLMIRGGDFYAIWIEEIGLWSTSEQDAVRIIDKEIDDYVNKNKHKFESYTTIKVRHMWDAESGAIDRWHKYCQKQMWDNFHQLDENLTFSNYETSRKDYASKKLSYPLEKGDISAYDKIMSTLYSEKEREKIEWAIGSIVSGDSKHIQKFMVLYGSAGTGKSTVLNIIQQLFEGYYAVFDAKALGSSSNSFALEPFRNNPLVGIQHDGDLSRIEDNTRINSLVSHELMTVNEKFKSTYDSRFKCFLFMGTNKPVKITDAKSGLIRRLIDVSPSGNKLAVNEYKRLVDQIKFELGAIAQHCLDIYLDDPGKYDDYIPISMLGASNDFYNFIEDSYMLFREQNGTTLKAAWEMYKTYCEEAKVPYPYAQRIFKEELKNYFYEVKDRYITDDGTRVRNYYYGFRTDQFESVKTSNDDECDLKLIEFNSTDSIFDTICADCVAQYATDDGIPMKKWDVVATKLSELDTSKLHYVRVPENHIVIDFDIPDEDGNKSYERNLEAASKFPTTYAELSKSESGIHLHYIYTGDVSELSRVYDDHIEIKVFTGNSSLRRKMTKCNDLPISTISAGLPLKGGNNKMINFEGFKSENALRSMINKNLNKEIHSATKPSIDFIYKNLEDAYNSNLNYDVSDMKNAVFAFAANSTNNADYCLKLVGKMRFKSEEPSVGFINNSAPLVFYDVEVFPNLFLVNWKARGKGKPVVRMINPKPEEIENLMKFRLVGFNCRRYDNHMLYARLMGYNNEKLYNLSQKIISGDKNVFFGEAYNISYTDVYDFCSKKQSLKKWEIELGIHHKELGLPWDQPVPEELWCKVAEYCDNDVIATEAVFEARQADFIAREILADLAGGTVNDTTNNLTAKVIFGNNRKPQNQFNYRNMGEISKDDYVKKGYDDYTRFNRNGKPVFPGYKYEFGKSIYRDEEVGEGGYVDAEPGIHGNVALLDITSMHPHNVIAEELFGKEFTARFKELVDARVNIKHEDWDALNGLLNGKLTKYVQKIINGELTSKDLAYALKIAINSVYGLTSAKFDNPFRDNRNVDNIVAKRGALFMINLKHEVKKRGYKVAHIKTDSIKIPDATPEIIQFVKDYGKMYGYNFEHEATYDRMCLVNDTVYIAKYATVEKCIELYGKEYVNTDILQDNKKHPNEWTATGTQFQVPYVFKTLFSKEDITFDDMCETNSVSVGTLNIDMNGNLPDVSAEEKEHAKLWKLINDKEHVDDNLSKECDRLEELSTIISTGHNYIFVGRVGQFCPIKSGCGGGILYREKDGKFYAVPGTKGYRWLESEMVKHLGKEKDIDRSYYDRLVDDAVETISQYGDFEWFVSDDPYIKNYQVPEFLLRTDPLPESLLS